MEKDIEILKQWQAEGASKVSSAVYSSDFLRLLRSCQKNQQFSQPEPGNLGQISEGKSTPIKAVSGGEHAKAVERFA